MRIFPLLLLIGLAGCSGGPGALGITGPHGSQLAPAPSNAESGAESPELKGDRFAPSLVPTTNGGHYWGYN